MTSIKRNFILCLTLLSTQMAFADDSNSNLPANLVQLKLNIMNESSADVYYAPYSISVFTGPAWFENDFVKCGAIERADNFPLSPGESATVTITTMKDSQCFDFLTTLSMSNDAPVVDQYNRPPTNHVAIDECNVVVQYNPEIKNVDSSLSCNGFYGYLFVDDESWDLSSNKEINVTLRNSS